MRWWVRVIDNDLRQNNQRNDWDGTITRTGIAIFYTLCTYLCSGGSLDRLGGEQEKHSTMIENNGKGSGDSCFSGNPELACDMQAGIGKE